MVRVFGAVVALRLAGLLPGSFHRWRAFGRHQTGDEQHNTTESVHDDDGDDGANETNEPVRVMGR